MNNPNEKFNIYFEHEPKVPKPEIIMTSRIVEAINLAIKAHNGQLYNGKDYFQEHVLDVLKLVCETQFRRNEDVLIATILHDVVEDTEVTLEEIKKKFGKNVVKLLDLVTHNKADDHYSVYTVRLKNSKNKGAITIKLCDLTSNLSKIENVENSFRKYLLRKKYLNALTYLTLGYFTEPSNY